MEISQYHVLPAAILPPLQFCNFIFSVWYLFLASGSGSDEEEEEDEGESSSQSEGEEEEEEEEGSVSGSGQSEQSAGNTLNFCFSDYCVRPVKQS